VLLISLKVEIIAVPVLHRENQAPAQRNWQVQGKQSTVGHVIDISEI